MSSGDCKSPVYDLLVRFQPMPFTKVLTNQSSQCMLSMYSLTGFSYPPCGAIQIPMDVWPSGLRRHPAKVLGVDSSRRFESYHIRS